MARSAHDTSSAEEKAKIRQRQSSSRFRPVESPELCTKSKVGGWADVCLQAFVVIQLDATHSEGGTSRLTQHLSDQDLIKSYLRTSGSRNA